MWPLAGWQHCASHNLLLHRSTVWMNVCVNLQETNAHALLYLKKKRKKKGVRELNIAVT